MTPEDVAGLWERHARWWVEEFTDGADPEYVDQIIPLVVAEAGGPGLVLDLGCGDGQIARALVATGSTVLGADPTGAQLEVARLRGGGPVYVQAEASRLPCGAESVDRVVVCLVLEHVDDLAAVAGEISRVLRPDGSVTLLLNHPLLQTPGSGWVDDQILDPPEQYWRVGPYLVETESVEEVSKGVRIRFVHRPLSRYVNQFAAAGLVVTQMTEPAPPESFLERAPEYRLAGTVPRLLHLHLSKAGSH